MRCSARDYQPAGAEYLRVENLNSGKRLQNINITLHSAEIVGLSGLVGAGRTELARAIFGVDKFDSGKIWLFDKEINDQSAMNMVKRGVSLLPEDRKSQGLALILPVAETLLYPVWINYFQSSLSIKIQKKKLP